VDPRIGTVFAGHRIEEVIGRGGASVVYLAEHLRLGRRVALKVLAPHLAEDEMFRERFIRESRIAAGLDHPNVVTVYDAGEVEDGLYISMRYVEGSDLGKILHDEGALEPPRAILILSQVASGLDAAHTQGLVHRDVKPGNVLVESPGSVRERAYLSDFGISKRTTTGSGLTRTGQFVGTVDYVAPEQITGEPIDGRTDVYSLGCVLYQCLSGRVPFHADTEVATIYRQLNDAAPVVEDFPDADGVNRVIAKALSKSKEDRYHSCGALIEAVRGPLAGTVAPPTVVRSRPSREPPHREESDTDVLAEPKPDGRSVRRWVAGLSAAAAITAVVIVGSLLLRDRDDPTRPTGPGDLTGGRTTGSSSTTPPPSGRRLQLTWNVVKERPLPGDQTMDDVGPTTEGLVAVGHVEGETEGGDDVGVWLSSGTDRWRKSLSPSLAGPGDQRALAVTEFGESLVAGGRDDTVAAAWISPNADLTWERSNSDLGEGEIRDFATVGDTLYAVGGTGPPIDQDAAVWTSTDGANWTPVADDDLLAPGDQQIWSVEAVDGSLVAVGYTYVVGGSYDGAIWVMTDGDWTRVDPSMFAGTGHQLMKAVAGGSDGLPFVVVGCEDTTWRCDTETQPSDAAVWTSEDGQTWTKVDLDGVDLVGEGIQRMLSLAVHEDTFVAAGMATANTGDLDAVVWTSIDGRTWSLDHRGFAVAVLGGEGDQAMRALTPFHRQNLTFIGVGVTDDGTNEDAQVWGGSS